MQIQALFFFVLSATVMSRSVAPQPSLNTRAVGINSSIRFASALDRRSVILVSPIHSLSTALNPPNNTDVNIAVSSSAQRRAGAPGSGSEDHGLTGEPKAPEDQKKDEKKDGDKKKDDDKKKGGDKKKDADKKKDGEKKKDRENKNEEAAKNEADNQEDDDKDGATEDGKKPGDKLPDTKEGIQQKIDAEKAKLAKLNQSVKAKEDRISELEARVSIAIISLRIQLESTVI
jgi:hypothetical protein